MMTLVTGGAASGKSEYAEQLAAVCAPPRVYVATMRPWDEECRARIGKHRKARAGRGFETLERYSGLSDLELPENACVLLECISNLAANEFFGEGGEPIPMEDALRAILGGVDALRAKAREIIVVSNEIFSDGGRCSPETSRYIDLVGVVNRELARRANRVVEVVCSIPILHKSEEEPA